ncbi:pyridine nucleotide-disulfide oxidoreductase [Parashewanella spongiae]|uniref:Pyridine nucleotide-disulfide oxidoreductase n=1 Tax=Parashewanella spongiae TaxID=342950 RepID=A0A3A6TZH2_9GAMM|nr:FAD-dependent oxidoreductase [Parashewanella spongiae]MCL1077480.1 FAD-dependent oxidoreductase [Parashewanella spongiae]RJY18383.1 pyridine nucleotide-disulfide oxidoreductase [Parashewanella spongiae]
MDHFLWCVVGAGPAGIAAVGKLLDAGIESDRIAWVDPYFQVGDFQKKWHRVVGNTQVKSFVNYLAHCRSFNYAQAPKFILSTFNPEISCRLEHIAEPLQWITSNFRKKVKDLTASVKALSMHNHQWHVELSNQTITADNVVLAHGAEPKNLTFDKPNIALDVALNDEKLMRLDLKDQIIGVFGSSHSAMVVLENLLNCNAKKVINFYRNPLKYAVYLDDFILFDNTGLKDGAANWARKHIDGSLPANLQRVHCTGDTEPKEMAECTKVIYAIGFEKRKNINIRPFGHNLEHNDTNGIIASGLFGLGIAYPCRVVDPLGNVEYDVGLGKFMCFLDRVMPVWMKYKA